MVESESSLENRIIKTLDWGPLIGPFSLAMTCGDMERELNIKERSGRYMALNTLYHLTTLTSLFLYDMKCHLLERLQIYLDISKFGGC